MELIKEGHIAADISRILDMNKSHVSYYITKAKNLGYVERTLRDAFALLTVTQRGKNLLDQYNKNNTTYPICRLENIQFKAKVIRMPTIPVDWKKIQMHNWIQYNSQIDRVKVRLNFGKIPMLVLLPSPVDGDDPNKLLIMMVYECMNALQQLEDRIGLRVGKLEILSKPEWVVYDPVAKSLCKYNGQVNYEGIGKVNASKPRRVGEIEFHDPRNLIDYIDMPARVKQIETKLDFIIDRLNIQQNP